MSQIDKLIRDVKREFAIDHVITEATFDALTAKLIHKRTPKMQAKRHSKPVPAPNVVNGVRTYPDGREVCQDTVAGRREYRQRTLLMTVRQNKLCVICGRELLVHEEPTFEHEVGRGMNGAHRDDRIEVNGKIQNAAVCPGCNSEKGSKRTPYKFQAVTR